MGEERQRRLPLYIGALVFGLLLAASAPQPEAGRPPRGDDRPLSWSDVDRLIDEQKLAAARELVAGLKEQAREAGDEDALTRALVREAQLTTALHGYETAVRQLRSEGWPDAPRQRLVLDLFYAHGLVTYLQAYSWEIRQREEVPLGEDLDLKLWTAGRIAAEADAAFARAWRQREAWGGGPVGDLSEYLEANRYPERIRGTLRDAVSYLWAGFLSDSSLWRPRDAAEAYRVDLAELMAAERLEGETALDGERHPLERFAAVLGDLESWHRLRDRPEAAFEALLERLRRLHDAFPSTADRALLRSELEGRLADLGREHEWWSVGMADLARWTELEDRPRALVDALELARQGLEAHPESYGGQRCRHVAASLEAPSYQLSAMASDGFGRPSLQVRHKNLGELFFRAYHLDLIEQLESGRDYNLLPAYREVERLVTSGQPLAAWRIELPPTPDLREHRTVAVPEIDGPPGLYVVVASARRDFARTRNRLVAANVVLGDLVLLSRTVDQRIEISARSGTDGRPLAGAELALYRLDYRKGHRRIETERTNPAGLAYFSPPQGRRTDFVVVGRHGDDLALEEGVRAPSGDRRSISERALVYTDRSAYRPGQEIAWKVVAYRADLPDQSYKVLDEARVEVELLDANGERVAIETVTTNRFGSASGRFDIPRGRLLGAWTVRSTPQGAASVRVEEYKRPTFEVELAATAGESRLNHPVELSGEARYYFGLPLAGGEVRWSVVREPLHRWHPWGRRLWGPRPVSPATEVVAGGETTVDSDGAFTIAFTPTADEGARERGTTGYRYRVEATVTDAGGETRSATRVLTLGFVAAEAGLDAERGYFAAGEPIVWRASRADLDGTPRPGAARWRLTQLIEPGSVELDRLPGPARPPVDGQEWYETDDDRLRPRWQQAPQLAEVLAGWSEKRESAAGEIEHDDEGEATIELPALMAGAYRLHYATEDLYGELFETARDFVVAAPSVKPGAKSDAAPLPAPVVLVADRAVVEVGDSVELLLHSGFADQRLVLELFQDGRRFERRELEALGGPQRLGITVDESLRGGFAARLTAVRDHRLLVAETSVFVPWTDRMLGLEIESFRDRLRPGDRERWTLRVVAPEGEELSSTAEVLAYMYDRSLELFAPHSPPQAGQLYTSRARPGALDASLGIATTAWSRDEGLAEVPGYPYLAPDRLKFFDNYGIGGPGIRSRMVSARAAPMMSLEEGARADVPMAAQARKAESAEATAPAPAEAAPTAESELRTDFSETALWEPHLVTDEDGRVGVELTVPDSVTEWSVRVHALTADLRGGSIERRTRTVKELLVRPYLPRFVREGDRAKLKVLVENAGGETRAGELELEISDPATGESLLAEFGLAAEETSGLAFEIAAGGSAEFTFPIAVPTRLGEVAVRVFARAGELGDGERRPLPVLPGRMHLVQSRFVALHDADRRSLDFADLAAGGDPTLETESLVVTVDGQLFQSVLAALPYLVDYPYECTEQTLNRMLSTGILTSLFDRSPELAEMARGMAERSSRFEAWDAEDPNREMALEETPWRVAAAGGDAMEPVLRVLDPEVAEAERRSALKRLEESQTSLGAFPWFPGGPPSPYMTLYVMHGFAKALEFGVEVPRGMAVEAWGYLHGHYLDRIVRDMVDNDCCWELVTYLNYVLSNYPDDSWTDGVFTAADRERMLDFSFAHWKQHSPLLKLYLALTLERGGRSKDAALVLDSVMDSAKTDRDLGTYWAPEDRAWLWYNDTIETHALALRTLSELDPDDERRPGLVQWLFLNKKLNHWKSTRATAEVIYSLADYLKREGQLLAREQIDVAVGDRRAEFVFEPDVFTGSTQLILQGEEVDPATMAEIVVSKETPGFAFASATWHYATDELPSEARGDLFAVQRSFFRRHLVGEDWTLEPLDAGDSIEVGDQLEVHLSIRARHAAEYVHLRDPRAAGLEPETLTSGYRWDLGLARYAEIRDSGTNFFFDWIPAGEYRLKYRLRAATAGSFKVAPATLQSMYAPEFAAFSAGSRLEIR